MTPSADVRLIESRSNREAAIDEMIAATHHMLRIFDRCLSPDYNTRRRCALLATLLQNAAGPHVLIALHECDDIARDHPRFASLARQFSHRIEICRVLPHAVHAQDAFVIADDHSYVHRFHCDQPRARHAVNDPGGARPLIDRFSAIREASEPGFAATTLGLAP
ncbi:MAG TPA: hypothetical protein VFK51_13825 [Burkholderiales bacterium]|jgi:hypothetical protein|nr:hypothetical protein [Burkholderiales bacterium]